MFHVHNIFMIVVFVKLQYLLKAVGRDKLWLRQCPWWNFLTRQQKRNAMTEAGAVVCLLLATTTKISPSITKQLLKKDWKVSQLVNFMQVFFEISKREAQKTLTMNNVQSESSNFLKSLHFCRNKASGFITNLFWSFVLSHDSFQNFSNGTR